jgi:hypothetical protein
MNYHILGLPISQSNAQFDEFVQRDYTLLISASQYPIRLQDSREWTNAPRGHADLLAQGYVWYEEQRMPQDINKAVYQLTSAWQGPQGQRNPPRVAAQQIAMMAQTLHTLYPVHQIAFMTPGSPRLWDGISSELVNQGWAMIDTASSVELACASLGITNYHTVEADDNRHITQECLLEGMPNVIGCLKHNYGTVLQADFMRDFTRATCVQVGLTNQITTVTIPEFFDLFKQDKTAEGVWILEKP